MAFNIIYQLTLSGLQIDFYGRCWEKEDTGTQNKLQRYKFYLAFGNVWHCRDYLSRDIWKNAFSVGAVPVIWGPKKEDVVKAFPPNSFIFLEDFASSFELTNYIEFLHNNDEEFIEYLLWREKSFGDLFSPAILESQSKNGFCQLCSKLHHLEPNRIYAAPPLRRWWLHGDSSYCVNPQYPFSNSLGFFWWLREYFVLKFHFNYPNFSGKTFNFCLFSKFFLLLLVMLLYCQSEQCQEVLINVLSLLANVSVQTRLGKILKTQFLRIYINIRRILNKR